MKAPLLIACDFDGTVTEQDTLVEILDRYGSDQWREIQDQVVAETLSIREGLQQEMSSVKASPEDLKSLLISKIQIDSTFPRFLKQMRERGIPVILLSGGFDLTIEPVLKKAALGPIPFLANRLIPVFSQENGQASLPDWKVEFPFQSENCNNCGHCKGDPIESWNEKGFKTIFVGNGVTDRCPARAATLTFAKDELLSWCQSERIPAVPYETFDDIEKELKTRAWL